MYCSALDPYDNNINIRNELNKISDFVVYNIKEELNKI